MNAKIWGRYLGSSRWIGLFLFCCKARSQIRQGFVQNSTFGKTKTKGNQNWLVVNSESIKKFDIHFVFQEDISVYLKFIKQKLKSDPNLFRATYMYEEEEEDPVHYNSNLVFDHSWQSFTFLFHWKWLTINWRYPLGSDARCAQLCPSTAVKRQ